MEFVCGGEFFTYLRKRARLDEQEARFFVVETVLAIEYLHACDVVYRDLKPENILLDAAGHVKITDFGFAKHARARTRARAAVARSVRARARVRARRQIVARTYTLCGTPDYLAPEVILNKGHGKPVDWWALGVRAPPPTRPPPRVARRRSRVARPDRPRRLLAGAHVRDARGLPAVLRRRAVGDLPEGAPRRGCSGPSEGGRARDAQRDSARARAQILALKLAFPAHFSRPARDLIKHLLQPDLTRRFGCLKARARHAHVRVRTLAGTQTRRARRRRRRPARSRSRGTRGSRT